MNKTDYIKVAKFCSLNGRSELPMRCPSTEEKQLPAEWQLIQMISQLQDKLEEVQRSLDFVRGYSKRRIAFLKADKVQLQSDLKQANLTLEETLKELQTLKQAYKKLETTCARQEVNILLGKDRYTETTARQTEHKLSIP